MAEEEEEKKYVGLKSCTDRPRWTIMIMTLPKACIPTLWYTSGTWASDTTYGVAEEWRIGGVAGVVQWDKILSARAIPPFLPFLLFFLIRIPYLYHTCTSIPFFLFFPTHPGPWLILLRSSAVATSWISPHPRVFANSCQSYYAWIDVEGNPRNRVKNFPGAGGL